jgi:zinc protease
MKRAAPWRITLLAVVLVGLAPTSLLAQNATPTKVVTIEGITEYRLDNGARFLLFPDPASDTVTVNMTVLVGSRHEGYGEAGMAHLLEHMLFKGTPTFPKIDKALQEHGAGRTANGTTWVDRTNYYETMPANDKNLEFGIRLEADRLLNSYVKREDLVREMTVVRNEFEQGENNPEYILSQRMMALAFEWHNYGKSTIGNRADIERVPIESLQAFYRKHYQPDNIVLTVAGKFDEKKALEYIGKYFGALKRPKRVLDKTYTEEPAQDGERVVTLRRVGKVPVVGLMYHLPAASHPDFAALDVLNTILVSEPRGRLYKALVETKKASQVSGSAYAWHDPGVLELSAVVNAGVKPEEVRDIMIGTTEELAKGKVTEAEVVRAKRKILAERERALSKSGRIAIELSEWIGAGDWRLLFLHRDRVDAVKAKDVERVAAQYLRQSNRTVGMFLPTSAPARTPIPSSKPADVVVKDYKGRKPISAGEAFQTTPQNIESRVKRLELPGGVKVALLPKKTRGEMVVGRYVLHFGNEGSLKDYRTAAGFMGSLMLRGTKKYTRQDIEDKLDVLGATLDASSGAGQLAFSFQAKRDQLGELLALLHEVARHPTFPADEFGILKRASLQELQKALSEPQPLAGNALRRHLNPYPKDSLHYVPTIPESILRVEAVTRDQVERLYREQVSGQAGEFVLVGDFDADAVLKQMKDLVAGWTTQVPYKRVAKQAQFKAPAGRHDINTPEKENAIYLSGYLFPMSQKAPDYPGLLLGNYVMGASGFNSRIFGTLREEKGLSYGAGSSLSVDPRDDYGQLTVYAIANPDNLKKADVLISEVIAKLLKEGITEAELATAKTGYLQDLKVARASDGSLSNLLRSGLELGRTMKYYEDLERRIAKLTVEDVNRALRAHIDPKRLYIVRAGDFEKGGKQK